MPELPDPDVKAFLTSQFGGSAETVAPGDNPVETPERALPLVLFDGSCGFCGTAVRILRGRWFKARVEAVPFQRVDLSVHNLTVDKCEETLHVVDGSEVFTGGEAIARILRSSRLPWPVVGAVLRLPGLRWLTGKVYAVVARNRHKLPGGTPACEMP